MTAKQRKKDNQTALRKELIQLRLELNRQKIRHETLQLLEPIEKLRGYKQRLSEGSTPLLIIAGITLASFFMTRNRRSANGLLPLVRIASSLLPLFMTASLKEKATSTEQTDYLNKKH